MQSLVKRLLERTEVEKHNARVEQRKAVKRLRQQAARTAQQQKGKTQ